MPKYQEYLDDPSTDFTKFELPTETHGGGEAYGEAWRPAGGHVNNAWTVATLGERPRPMHLLSCTCTCTVPLPAATVQPDCQPCMC